MTERGHLRSIQGEGQGFDVSQIEGSVFEVRLPNEFPVSQIGNLSMNICFTTHIETILARREPSTLGLVTEAGTNRTIVQPDVSPHLFLAVRVRSSAITPDEIGKIKDDIASAVRYRLGKIAGQASSYRT